MPVRRCCQKIMVLVPHTCHKRFQEWIGKGVFEKLWIRLLEVYNDIHGIEWGWMAVTR
jgi:transposase